MDKLPINETINFGTRMHASVYIGVVKEFFKDTWEITFRVPLIIDKLEKYPKAVPLFHHEYDIVENDEVIVFVTTQSDPTQCYYMPITLYKYIGLKHGTTFVDITRDGILDLETNNFYTFAINNSEHRTIGERTDVSHKHTIDANELHIHIPVNSSTQTSILSDRKLPEVPSTVTGKYTADITGSHEVKITGSSNVEISGSNKVIAGVSSTYANKNGLFLYGNLYPGEFLVSADVPPGTFFEYNNILYIVNSCSGGKMSVTVTPVVKFIPTIQDENTLYMMSSSLDPNLIGPGSYIQLLSTYKYYKVISLVTSKDDDPDFDTNRTYDDVEYDYYMTIQELTLGTVEITQEVAVKENAVKMYCNNNSCVGLTGVYKIACWGIPKEDSSSSIFTIGRVTGYIELALINGRVVGVASTALKYPNEIRLYSNENTDITEFPSTLTSGVGVGIIRNTTGLDNRIVKFKLSSEIINT